MLPAAFGTFGSLGPTMRWGNPTTFLPALPRDQGSLAPLSPSDLLGYMEVLKEMYMPPIHGGFTAADVDFDAEPEERGGRKRSRTLSGGSVDMPGLGLEMEGLGLAPVPIAEERAQRDEFDDFDDDDDQVDYHEEDEGGDDGHDDPFEREWAEKWLGGVVRRAQTWLEENDAEDADAETAKAVAETEAVLRDATAVLALMAGTSAAGSLTRHLLFPLAPELAPALRALAPWRRDDASLSPETTRFLAKLASSPASPLVSMRPLASGGGRSPDGRSLSRSPAASFSRSPTTGFRRPPSKPATLPVLLHDAPITDHISVGVQTWGSAILLGREMALRPAHFGLFQDVLPHGGGTRVLELGAGTGLLSILCRKLLDLRAASTALGTSGGSIPVKPRGVMGTVPEEQPAGQSAQASVLASAAADTGIVVATDFHPDVLSNLRVCVDLNAPPRLPDAPATAGIDIAKLDWTTFPAFMRRRARALAGYEANGDKEDDQEEEELARWLDTPFDLVIASDCVYDPTHAGMIRDVAGWVVRPPGPNDNGGVLVSPGVNRRYRLSPFIVCASRLTAAPSLTYAPDVHPRAREYRRGLPPALVLPASRGAPRRCGRSLNRGPAVRERTGRVAGRRARRRAGTPAWRAWE